MLLHEGWYLLLFVERQTDRQKTIKIINIHIYSQRFETLSTPRGMEYLSDKDKKKVCSLTFFVSVLGVFGGVTCLMRGHLLLLFTHRREVVLLDPAHWDSRRRVQLERNKNTRQRNKRVWTCRIYVWNVVSVCWKILLTLLWTNQNLEILIDTEYSYCPKYYQLYISYKCLEGYFT